MALTQITTKGIKDGTIIGADLTTNVDLVDNQKIRFGTGNDLEIFHDGSHSRFHNSTGIISMQASGYRFNDTLGIENCLDIDANGAVSLYFDHSKKFETSSSGTVTEGNNSTGNLIKGVTRFCPSGSTTVKAMWDETGFSGAGHFQVKDGVAFTAGDSSDLKIYHDGTESWIKNSTGTLNVLNDGSFQFKNLADNQTIAQFNAGGECKLFHSNTACIETTSDGVKISRPILEIQSTSCQLDMMETGGPSTHHRLRQNTGNFHIQTINGDKTSSVTALKVDGGNENVELYHGGNKKLETSAGGVNVTGELNVTTKVAYPDNAKAIFGTGDDLQIFHDGSNSIINDTGTGQLQIASNALRINNAANNENMIAADENSEVRIYHDNVEKLKTTSSGVTVIGTVQETSDIALKSDIRPLTNTLEKIQQITGYKYNLINSTSPSMGVIAQDVEKVFPELVHGSEGNKTLQYSGLIGVLVEAIKDLSAKVASLEAT